MSTSTKIRYLVTMVIFYFSAYIFIQAAITTHKFDFLTPLDTAIPLMTEYIWIYHSLLPVITITMIFLVKSRVLFMNTFWACIIAAVVLNISYVFLPSFYPRIPFDINSLSDALLYWTRQIDGANNTFPSGHVTYAWLLYLGASRCQFVTQNPPLSRIYLLWAIGISLSTLVLKQHYIVDVFSGITLAYASFYLAKPLAIKYEKLLIEEGLINETQASK